MLGIINNWKIATVLPSGSFHSKEGGIEQSHKHIYNYALCCEGKVNSTSRDYYVAPEVRTGWRSGKTSGGNNI